MTQQRIPKLKSDDLLQVGLVYPGIYKEGRVTIAKLSLRFFFFRRCSKSNFVAVFFILEGCGNCPSVFEIDLT